MGVCTIAPATARCDEPLSTDDVTQMSLEELLAVPVTSVAGTRQDLHAAPAAITVLTGDEVRRSGFRSLADALRMAPGVFVGHSGSSTYSVGMRGFNGSLANKTLVLIDGRTVYDPIFGGTFWDVQDVLLEDLDRIEVIRGPGATLWGANAVNGVINIITKGAEQTQGLYLAGGGGTFERAFAEARYGFKIDDDTFMRVHGKWFMRDAFTLASGDTLHDNWDMARGGFRVDHGREADLRLTLQADFYDAPHLSEYNPLFALPGKNLQWGGPDIHDVRRRGANVLARLSHEGAESGWSLQGSYDRTERETNVTFLAERDTFDLDFRHHFKLGERHELVWGVGARYTQDHTRNGVGLLLDPHDGELGIYSAFVQDTITIVPDHLFAMIGSKLLWNDYTGFEVQPGGRLWWTPDERHTLWASVSSPVRVPSRTEEQGTLAFGYIDEGLLHGGAPTGVIVPLGIQANDDLTSERLVAFESGYRVHLTDELTLDAAGFYNMYDRLIYVKTGLDPFNNASTAETFGGEIAATIRPCDELRLEASYSFVNVLIHGSAAPTDEALTPHNQAQVRAYWSPNEDLDVFGALYYVDQVEQGAIDPYLRLDLGVTWRVTPNFELKIVGQNLLEDQHRESSAAAQVPRGVYVMGALRF